MIQRISLTWRQNSSKSVNLFLFLLCFVSIFVSISSIYYNNSLLLLQPIKNNSRYLVRFCCVWSATFCLFLFRFFYTRTIYKCKIYGFEIESNSVEKTTQFARWNMYNYYRLVTVLFVIAAITEFLLIRFIFCFK